MILLDTDHFTVLKYWDSARAMALADRLRAAGDSGAVTVITVEEQLRGWLAKIHKAKDVRDQIEPYRKLGELIQAFRRLTIAPFTETAADTFQHLRKQKVRIGTMDLKIAAIALANDALLLTANRRDFARVPGLRIENWLGDSSH